MAAAGPGPVKEAAGRAGRVFRVLHRQSGCCYKMQTQLTSAEQHIQRRAAVHTNYLKGHTHGTAGAAPCPPTQGTLDRQVGHPAVAQTERLAVVDKQAVAMILAMLHQRVALARVAANCPACQDAHEPLVLELCCRASQFVVSAAQCTGAITTYASGNELQCVVLQPVLPIAYAAKARNNESRHKCTFWIEHSTLVK